MSALSVVRAFFACLIGRLLVFFGGCADEKSCIIMIR